MKFYGVVKNFVITGINRSQMANYIAGLEGLRIVIDISEYDKRSVKQNALLWNYHRMIGEFLGYRPEEIHEIVKFKFLKREKVDENTGLVFEYLKSTTELSKGEFNDLIRDYRLWALNNFGYDLPEPNSQFELPIEE